MKSPAGPVDRGPAPPAGHLLSRIPTHRKGTIARPPATKETESPGDRVARFRNEGRGDADLFLIRKTRPTGQSGSRVLKLSHVCGINISTKIQTSPTGSGESGDHQRIPSGRSSFRAGAGPTRPSWISDAERRRWGLGPEGRRSAARISRSRGRRGDTAGVFTAGKSEPGRFLRAPVQIRRFERITGRIHEPDVARPTGPGRYPGGVFLRHTPGDRARSGQMRP